MVLAVRIKPRALREIERAAEWWAENRPAAPGAVRMDVEAALALLVEEPGIGTKIETARSDTLEFGAFYTTASAATFLRLSRSRTRVAKMAHHFKAMTPKRSVKRRP